MRYPIVRSNSRLSFAFQEPTRPCSPNIQSTFDFADAIDIWLGRTQRNSSRCGRKSKAGVRASSPTIADPATRFSPFSPSQYQAQDIVVTLIASWSKPGTPSGCSLRNTRILGLQVTKTLKLL